MPQIWLTFEEIADLFYCDTAGARRRVIANQWERRRYHDGLTRAQLPPELAHEFMLRYSSKHKSVGEFDAAMAALRRAFRQTETDTCEGHRLREDGVMTLKGPAIGPLAPASSPLPLSVGRGPLSAFPANSSVCGAVR
jgi:hypothetical protein